jgi:hypothetical protein
MSGFLRFVIAGLDPAIHAASHMDHRVIGGQGPQHATQSVSYVWGGNGADCSAIYNVKQRRGLTCKLHRSRDADRTRVIVQACPNLCLKTHGRHFILLPSNEGSGAPNGASISDCRA